MHKILSIILLLICSQTSSRAFPIRIKPPAPAPAYYSLEDLRSGLKQQSFCFANYSKPFNARVDLGAVPNYPASSAARELLGVKLKRSPTRYRVNAARIYSYWNDTSSIPFNWDQFRREGGRKGDLIFTRANSFGPNIVKIFSNWTHVAIVLDDNAETVYEALPNSGVDINFAPNSWGNVCYYTSKRLSNLNSWDIERAVDRSIASFRYLPYFPITPVTTALSAFLIKWSNKDDPSSMYCSKLVYHTFKPLVNLDSNYTEIMNQEYWDKTAAAPLFSWIGVSPDDIYYSYDLGPDFCLSPNLISDGLARAGVS